MIFETHAHYDDEKFDSDRDTLIPKLLGDRICTIINVASSIDSTKTSLALAEKYDAVYAAVGVHPSDIDGLNEETFSWLKEQTRHPKAVAIGEIGLDYYWEKDPAVLSMQRHWFKEQLLLAKECSLPVIIHSRDAAADTLSILKETCPGELRGVIHCYSYSPELAQEFIRLGFHIGVGGIVTFKNAKKLKETVQQIPLEKVLLETDSPYMAPEPHRGTRNDSGNLPFVAEQIAALKDISEEQVEAVTCENAKKLFHL